MLLGMIVLALLAWRLYVEESEMVTQILIHIYRSGTRRTGYICKTV